MKTAMYDHLGQHLAVSSHNEKLFQTKAVKETKRHTLHSIIVFSLLIPVAAPSKTWVCSRSLRGIAGSNPAGGMDVCLSVVSVVCCTGRGPCDGPFSRLEEVYRICVCDCVCRYV
jgi:hypothetical protein